MRYLIFFLLICSTAYAGQKELDQEISRSSKLGITLTQKDRDDLISKGWRGRKSGEFKPPVTETVRPSDYVDDFNRGSIEFNPNWRNYSFHKIKVPSGSVLKEMNFTQISPDTDAFDRTPGIYGHNLTFIDCNLVNVRTYPDWTIKGSNTAQIDFSKNAVLDDKTVTPEVI